MYTWAFDKAALKEFKNLDKLVQKRILKFLEENIQGTDDPRQHGKSLAGELGTLWRYRVGKYRIIADIRDNECVVLVVKASKRGVVYL